VTAAQSRGELSLGIFTSSAGNCVSRVPSHFTARLLFRASVTGLTELFRFPRYGPYTENDVVWHQEADMAARTRFALVFWAAVAVVVTILTIKPWTSAPEAQGKSATPIAAREIIYRPQHWNVY
jgi:hypothetical protein